VKPRFVLALSLATAIAFVAPLIMRRAPTLAQEVAQQPAAAKPMLVGVASCSASVCHGGSDLGKPLSEATTWQALDPHARAYDTLLSESSRAIAKHLWAGKTQAHEAPLCLRCHVHPDYEHARPNFRKQSGVGCESCHGAALDWVATHYRGDKRGMADTKSLYGRATICVRCHVGTAEANVDHDLIAAGHPALRFEFATYLANLPPHWDVAKDKGQWTSDDGWAFFEGRTWAIGQSVTVQTALNLLAHRADPANGKSWPEFAELSCFSCHHDLNAASWRQTDLHLADRRPGRLAWSEWYFAAARHLNEDFADFRPAIKDRAELSRRAKKEADAFHRALDKPRAEIGYVVLLEGFARDTDRLVDWDVATQKYLALLAVAQMRRDNRNPRDSLLESQIAALRKELTFEHGFASPKRFAPKGFFQRPEK
jgi:hypothetical protein